MKLFRVENNSHKFEDKTLYQKGKALFLSLLLAHSLFGILSPQRRQRPCGG
jgi:hypothetical protein